MLYIEYGIVCSTKSKRFRQLNDEGLKWYLEQPDQQDKENYFKSLSKYAGTISSDSDTSDFKSPPPHVKSVQKSVEE